MEHSLCAGVNTDMSDIGKRFGMLREMRRKHLLQLRANCSVPEKDRNGSASNSLVGTLRFLGVAGYVLDKDVAAFRSDLAEAAAVSVRLFDRFSSGEPVSPSYVSMMAYKELFNALASGEAGLAKAFAERMGGRDAIEREYDRPFDVALGYAIKSILAADDVSAARYLGSLEIACQEPENADFIGYATVLRAILKQDGEAAKSAFGEVVAGHKRQSKSGGLFKDTEDELLSVWGVGLANLARMRGLMVEASDPLIPNDLLV